MAFDSDPTADHDRLASLPAETVRQLAGRRSTLYARLCGDVTSGGGFSAEGAM